MPDMKDVDERPQSGETNAGENALRRWASLGARSLRRTGNKKQPTREPPRPKRAERKSAGSR